MRGLALGVGGRAETGSNLAIVKRQTFGVNLASVDTVALQRVGFEFFRLPLAPCFLSNRPLAARSLPLVLTNRDGNIRRPASTSSPSSL